MVSPAPEPSVTVGGGTENARLTTTVWWSFFIVVLIVALILGAGVFIYRRRLHEMHIDDLKACTCCPQLPITKLYNRVSQTVTVRLPEPAAVVDDKPV